MDLDLDAKNILEMKMIKECITESQSLNDQMKKQLLNFMEEIVKCLNDGSKIDVSIIVEETSMSESSDDDDLYMWGND